MASMLKSGEKVVVEFGPGRRWGLYKLDRVTDDMRGWFKGSRGFMCTHIHINSIYGYKYIFDIVVEVGYTRPQV